MGEQSTSGADTCEVALTVWRVTCCCCHGCVLVVGCSISERKTERERERECYKHLIRQLKAQQAEHIQEPENTISSSGSLGRLSTGRHQSPLPKPRDINKQQPPSAREGATCNRSVTCMSTSARAMGSEP